MSPPVSLTIHDRILLATVDHPPVNALSHAVRAGLWAALERLESDAALDALVIVCGGKTFFSGADIKEFGKPMQEPLLPAVIEGLEAATKPVLAAIHGKALGGGLELALACHYRVALGSARIGLPEVKLGLVPGAGGTQRLPRLVGLAAALPVITEGTELTAARARELGAIDTVIEGDLAAGALAFARALIARGAGVRRTGELPPPERDDALLEETRKTLARKKRGHRAPQAGVEALCLMWEHPFAEACRRENALCHDLMQGSQSKALRHLFAAEREVARLPALDGAEARAVQTVGVVGPGTMGLGIAQASANAGLDVILVAGDAAKAAAAHARLQKGWAALVAKGSLPQTEADARLARVRCTESLDALAGTDLVIESISESRESKRALFTALGRITSPGTVLASNTSYLDIDALAEASGRPADVCGMHFFNPANVMRLLEAVRASASSPVALATVIALGRRLGKLPILTGNCEGFVVNRMLGKRSREGFFMLEEGARPEQIDRVLTGFGFPMGPYALADLAGIDLQYAARQIRLPGMSTRERSADFVDQLHALGRFGQKTGAGWYRYGEDRKAAPDPAIEALLAAHARARGITQRTVEDREVLERCLYAMVNEGARLIDEGIVARPQEIDIAMVNGIGWPEVTGGPMWWADSIGLPAVCEAMSRYAAIAGEDYWTPAPLLARRAREGRGFYG